MKDKSLQIKIRKANLHDLDAIRLLISEGARQGAVLDRSRQEILEHLRDFWVAEVPAKGVVGVVALHFISEKMCEIRSLVVEKKWQGMGVGARLIRRALSEARKYGFKEVLALVQKPDIYLNHGFEHRRKESLPHKIWRDCINCPKFPSCDEEAYVKELSG